MTQRMMKRNSIFVLPLAMIDDFDELEMSLALMLVEPFWSRVDDHAADGCG